MPIDAVTLEYLWRDGPWILLASLTTTVLLLIMLRPWLARYALARPNSRSSHKKPTPQGAGAAIVAVTLLIAAVTWGLRGMFPPASIWFVFAAVILVAVIGAVDDIRTLTVRTRLLLQAAGVALVVIFLSDETRVFASLPFWVERALLFLAGLWFINLTNFMDGLDWMMVVEVLPISIALAIAALLGALPIYTLPITLALAGAMLGFAPFNKPVARMFLGDVGSLPIGLLIGWLLVLLAGRGHFVAAFLLPLYFVADATLTLARRVFRREAVWEAHRSHFYQRATDRGFGVTKIVALVFVLNCVLASLSLLTIIMPKYPVALCAFGAGLALVGLLLFNFIRGEYIRDESKL
jgi:UDP-N-acetylmuramyl pentapeptide phosphotransferase/UDP-N-acetylglucosamine-1-phosphate transferase